MCWGGDRMKKALMGVALSVALCGCVTQSKGPELRAVASNPAYTPEQAHAICYGEAMDIASGYPTLSPISATVVLGYDTIDTSCSTLGNYTSCTSRGRESSGGFASGFAEALEKGRERRASRSYRSNSEKRSIYYSCLAKIGYVKAN